VTQGYTMHTPLKMIPSITLKEKVWRLKCRQGSLSWFRKCPRSKNSSKIVSFDAKCAIWCKNYAEK
jgi:hypothetical protein